MANPLLKSNIQVPSLVTVIILEFFVISSTSPQHTGCSKLKTVSSAPCLYRVIENNTSGKTRLSRRRVLHSFYDFSETFTSNRFHVAVLLFSNRSHMTSKCPKDKNVAYEAIASSVTDVLTSHLQYYPNSQVFPPFYNTKGRTFNDGVNRASALQSKCENK